MVEDVREEGFTRSNGRCSENRTDPVDPATKCQSSSTRQVHDDAACARMACAGMRLRLGMCSLDGCRLPEIRRGADVCVDRDRVNRGPTRFSLIVDLDERKLTKFVARL
ncbi:hypothetical protein HN011_001066 [Eciton burchellii]|jgi:hypothetical protein|nr:hypothetical protein HN011_001066 [Eciton burchellii]